MDTTAAEIATNRLKTARRTTNNKMCILFNAQQILTLAEFAAEDSKKKPATMLLIEAKRQVKKAQKQAEKAEKAEKKAYAFWLFSLKLK